MFTLAYDNLIAMLLVFVRFGAMFFTNPIFSRRQFPMTVRAALVLFTSILIYPVIDTSAVEGLDELLFAVVFFKELLIGIFFSLLFSIFYYMLFFVGDFIDIQFGLSMAKAMDPSIGIQASISGRLFEIYFVLYFFATNAHLTVIRLFVDSFEFIPLGYDFNINGTSFMISVFTSIIVLLMQMILPFLVTILIMEVALAILMKLVPQMHIMVINIQMKIMMGLFLLVALAFPLSEFINNYIVSMLQALQKGLQELVI